VAVARLPFSVALMVALWFEGRVPAVAVKIAEVLLAGTVTEVGTVK